jgi:hypothetical protein
MKTSLTIFVVGCFGLIANAAIAQAQVRDAGSKILGHYDHFDQPAQGQVSRSYSTPTSPVNRATEPVTSSQRAFSYEATNPSVPRMTQQAAPNGQASRQSAPQPTRRFSYDPGSTSAPARSYVPGTRARGWQSGVRDASSKVLGNY